MELIEEFLTEMMIQMRKEYVRLVEIERLTKELGDTLSRDDRESVQTLLELRQKEMDEAEEAKRAVGAILQELDMAERARIVPLLEGKKNFQADGMIEKKIGEMGCQIQNCLQEIIRVDKVISRKLAGSDSYYKKISE